MADVTICIPAWKSEAFIAKTLQCARDQSNANIRIFVSIDQCDDATVSICEEQAAEDPRIRVFVQSERLGWARNVNFLLDQVETEFFFLYFHDDVILPDYTARLLQVLRERPDAGSVHCDMGHFGAKDSISIGRNYEGTPVRRLLTFLSAPQRGSPLRSLTRSRLLENGLRLPTDAVAGFWANEPYLMRLISAGPAIRIPEVLYLRWDQRAGGLTDGWKKLSPDQVISGFQSNTRTSLKILNEISASESESRLLVFAFYVQTMLKFRLAEKSLKMPTSTEAEHLNPAFANISIPEEPAMMEPEIKDWIMRNVEQLSRLEGKLAGKH